MSLILVAEDDVHIGLLVRMILEAEGYDVEVFTDGTEVVARLRNGPAPAALILDLLLPGMGGLDVVQALRTDPGTERLPILVLSALAGEAQRIEVLRRGANAYIAKPFDLNEVTAVVRSLAGGPPAR